MAAMTVDMKKGRSDYLAPALPIFSLQSSVFSYDALAVRFTVTRLVGAALAALARAIERVFVEKQRSRARSTFCSIASVFSRATSEISEMTRNFARSSMRFSRNDRFFDFARKVRLLRTSTTS